MLVERVQDEANNWTIIQESDLVRINHEDRRPAV